MNNPPLVTIGIPAYNAERFIALAIKSVLAQTYPNFELIITDDGSSDRTIEIARSFNDSRIKVLSDGENHGISYRLNQQIDIARGKYFARMDADDIMFPDRIELQVKYLEKNPEVDVVSGQAVVIDDENEIIGLRGTATQIQELTLDRWINGFSLIHPTVTGSSDFFRRYKYHDKFKGVEDIDLWARACEMCKLLVLPIRVMFYRDPLKFKLKTYNFRRKQAEKLYKELAHKGILDNSVCKRLIWESKIKSIIAKILSYLQMDHVMLSRRNKPIIEKDYYNYILRKIEG